MKVLVVGKEGQLGLEFVKYFEQKGANFCAVGRKECDITDLEQVIDILKQTKPDIVINCVAYNQVDKAETNYASAYKVNAIGVRNLAYACKKYNNFLIHFSTDYVFDGKKENGLYTESDEPNPVNEYGKSKLTGEKWLVEEGLKDYLIFRTSWVYGDGTQNFIYKLIQWARSSEYLKIAYDEVSVPTSTKTIVKATSKAIDRGLNGLFHLTNSNYASRYEWAKKILEIKGINKFVYPVSKEIFNLPAKRPNFSAMSNEKVVKELEIEIGAWEEELEKVLKN